MQAKGYNLKEDTVIFFKEIKIKTIYFFKKENKLHLSLFFIFLAFAIFIRIYYINTTLRFDEAFSFTYIKQPFLLLITNYAHSNNHVLSSLLSHFFSTILGFKLWTIRIPVLIFGILLVPETYLAARIISNKETALLSMGIISISPAIIEYSTNARGYILITFFFVTIISLSNSLIKKQNIFTWLIFALIIALGFYTLFAMVYPFSFLIIWIFFSIIFKDSEENIKISIFNLVIFTILSLTLALLLYMPMIVKSGIKQFKFLYNNGGKHYDPWSIYFKNFANLIKNIWIQWSFGFPLTIIILLLIGIIISTIYYKRIFKFKVPLQYIFLFLLIFILLFKTPIDYPRFFLFVLPVFIIISSSGIIFILNFLFKNIKLKKILIYIIIIIFIFIISFPVIKLNAIDYVNDTGKLPDAKEITEFFKNELKDGDVVLSRCPSNLILEYYFEKNNIPAKYYNNLDNLYSRIFFVVNKTTKQTVSFVGDIYNLKTELYKNPKLIKETKFSEIYLSELKNLKFNEILNLKEIIFSRNNNYFIDKNNKKTDLNFENNNLKVFSYPVTLKASTNYLIEFRIYRVTDKINFDFYGNNYDSSDQEFVVLPDEIKNEYINKSIIINSKNIPENTQVTFRIFLNNFLTAEIKDLKIKEINVINP